MVYQKTNFIENFTNLLKYNDMDGLYDLFMSQLAQLLVKQRNAVTQALQGAGVNTGNGSREALALAIEKSVMAGNESAIKALSDLIIKQNLGKSTQYQGDNGLQFGGNRSGLQFGGNKSSSGLRFGDNSGSEIRASTPAPKPEKDKKGFDFSKFNTISEAAGKALQGVIGIGQSIKQGRQPKNDILNNVNTQTGGGYTPPKTGMSLGAKIGIGAALVSTLLIVTFAAVKLSKPKTAGAPGAAPAA